MTTAISAVAASARRDVTERGERAEGAKLLTYGQVVEEFGIKIGTLYALVHDRRIPHVRLGRRFVRFLREDVEQWVTTHVVAERGQP